MFSRLMDEKRFLFLSHFDGYGASGANEVGTKLTVVDDTSRAYQRENSTFD